MSINNNFIFFHLRIIYLKYNNNNNNQINIMIHNNSDQFIDIQIDYPDILNIYKFTRYKPWKTNKVNFYSILYMIVNSFFCLLIVTAFLLHAFQDIDISVYYFIIPAIFIYIASSSFVDGCLNSLLATIYKLYNLYGNKSDTVIKKYNGTYHILVSYMLKAKTIDDVNKTFISIKTSYQNTLNEIKICSSTIVDYALVSGTDNKDLIKYEKNLAKSNGILYFHRTNSNLKKLGQIIDLIAFLNTKDDKPNKYMDGRINTDIMFDDIEEIKLYFESISSYPNYIYTCDYDTVLTTCSIKPIMDVIEDYQDSYVIYQPDVVYTGNSSVVFETDLSRSDNKYHEIYNAISNYKDITIFQKRQIDACIFSDDSLYIWNTIFKYSRFHGKGLICVDQYYDKIISTECIPDFVLSHDTIETMVVPVYYCKDAIVLEECIETVPQKFIQLIRWTMGEIKNIYLINKFTRYTIFLIPHLLFYRFKVFNKLVTEDYKARYMFLKNISQHFGMCIISWLAIFGLVLLPILDLNPKYIYTLELQLFLLFYPIIKALILYKEKPITFAKIYSFIELSLLYTPIISMLSIVSAIASFILVYSNQSFWITSSSKPTKIQQMIINSITFTAGLMIIGYCFYKYYFYNYIYSYIYWYFGIINLISPLYIHYLNIKINS